MVKNILNQLNVFDQCRKYNISIWQCPQFLFLIMGIVIIISSISSYLIGLHYIEDLQIVVFIVLLTATFLFIISYAIIQNFERLAEVSRMKSEFISIVSHQLRSPLTNVKWAIEILFSRDFKLPINKKDEYITNIKENVERMAELIDELLIVSKIEQGKIPINKKEVSLNKLINEVIERYQYFVQASNIKVFFSFPQEIFSVFTDPSLLKLVIENLMDNAIRYVKHEGRIEVRLEKKKEKVLFSIKDNGIGIPKSEQKYIFQKFFRAKNAVKERTRGNGLGLYVCKTIINNLGGKIWFKSEEGKGTTFYFFLPTK